MLTEEYFTLNSSLSTPTGGESNLTEESKNRKKQIGETAFVGS